jgi:hypothetical protein
MCPGYLKNPFLGLSYKEFIMTNEQQKPATPTNPTPAPQQDQQNQQSQSPAKPSTDKPGVQQQQK